MGTLQKGRAPSAGSHRKFEPKMGLQGGLGGIIGGAMNLHASVTVKKEVSHLCSIAPSADICW